MEFLDFLSLGSTYRRYFEIVPAFSDAERGAVYRLRHQVYCEELGFEPLRADRRETDEYDAHSLHCLLRNSTTKEDVGCIRLIMTRPAEPAHLLPFERTCERTIDRTKCDPAAIPRERIAEVSRLAVIRSYRRRKGEDTMPVGISDDEFGAPERPRFPYVPLTLYCGMIALARRRGIEHLFVLTEPKLAAHLARLGIEIRQIGDPVEHRGQRVPSVMSVPDILENMRMIFRPFYRMVDEEVEDALRAAGEPHLAP